MIPNIFAWFIGGILYKKNYDEYYEKGQERIIKELALGSPLPGRRTFRKGYSNFLEKVQIFSQDITRGMIGGHNKKVFYKYFTEELGLEEHEFIEKIVQHPDIDGIYEITYKIPKVDSQGNSTGDYKSFISSKTVYDPKIISKSQICRKAKKALNSKTAIIQKNSIIGSAKNGLIFKGYFDGTMNESSKKIINLELIFKGNLNNNTPRKYSNINAMEIFFNDLDFGIKKLSLLLENSIKKQGTGIDDYMTCAFANEYEEYEEGYFGKEGIKFVIQEPAVEEEMEEAFTLQEFYDYLYQYCQEDYLDKNPTEKEEINILLEKIQKKFDFLM